MNSMIQKKSFMVYGDNRVKLRIKSFLLKQIQCTIKKKNIKYKISNNFQTKTSTTFQREIV